MSVCKHKRGEYCGLRNDIRAKSLKIKSYCIQGPCPDESPMTNSDRIRAMTDKELAHLMGEYAMCENCLAHSDACETEYDNPADVPSCEQIWLDWLKEEAKE